MIASILEELAKTQYFEIMNPKYSMLLIGKEGILTFQHEVDTHVVSPVHALHGLARSLNRPKYYRRIQEQNHSNICENFLS